MKINVISISFILSMMALRAAHADFSCELVTVNGGGRVYLVGEFELKGQPLLFAHYLGSENFENPFYLRNKCENYRSAINAEVETSFEEKWEFSYCSNRIDMEELVLLLHVRQEDLKFKSNVFFQPTKMINRYGSTEKCDSEY